MTTLDQLTEEIQSAWAADQTGDMRRYSGIINALRKLPEVSDLKKESLEPFLVALHEPIEHLPPCAETLAETAISASVSIANAYRYLAEHAKGKRRVNFFRKIHQIYCISGQIGTESGNWNHAVHAVSLAAEAARCVALEETKKDEQLQYGRRAYELKQKSAEWALKIGEVEHAANFTSYAGNIAEFMVELSEGEEQAMFRKHWYERKRESATLFEKIGQPRNVVNGLAMASRAARSIVESGKRPQEKLMYLKEAYECNIKSGETAVRIGMRKEGMHAFAIARDVANDVAETSQNFEEQLTYLHLGYTSVHRAVQLAIELDDLEHATHCFSFAGGSAMQIVEKSKDLKERIQYAGHAAADFGQSGITANEIQNWNHGAHQFSFLSKARLYLAVLDKDNRAEHLVAVHEAIERSLHAQKVLAVDEAPKPLFHNIENAVYAYMLQGEYVRAYQSALDLKKMSSAQAKKAPQLIAVCRELKEGKNGYVALRAFEHFVRKEQIVPIIYNGLLDHCRALLPQKP